MFSNEQWLANSGADFYNGVATQSLRFDDGSSAFLSRTPAGASNQKTWTFSAWIKPSNVTISRSIFARHDSGSNTFLFRLDQNDDLQVENYTSGAYQLHLVTDAKFRDTSAWYHVVLSLDTTQGTAANRAKLYVNGVQQTSFSSSTYPSQNADLKVNAAAVHRIGARAPDNYFDGYMAEVNFVDGTQLAPTSFGETKNGVWIPIDTSGLTFGTNGFRLDFADNAVDAPTSEGTEDTDNIGSDSSGEHNNWTSSGIVASDCAMPDSPENNFATMNPLDKHATFPALAEGNLKTVNAGSAWFYCRSTFSVTSGKWYVEIRQTGLYIFMGVLAQTLGLTTNSSSNSTGVYACFNSNGDLIPYSTGTSGSDSGDFTDGDIVGLAYDYDAQTLKIYQNNTLRATVSSIPKTEAMSFMCGTAEVTNTTVWNFGQDASFAGAITAGTATDGNGKGVFKYAPPSGYLALCTANLPEPTIGANSDTQADDYFETVLWTGNATDDTAIAVNFQPDFTWIKQRSGTAYHNLSNSTVGATKALFSNATDVEGTNADRLKAFTSTGFTLGDATDVNGNSSTYVAWNWLANGGTTVTNEDGSIDSTVQANTDAGFSIVTYSGNADASATIGHGLGVVPKMIMVKQRDEVGNWIVFTETTGATNKLNLNATTASATSALFNDTAPTSTVFSVKDTSTDDTFGDGHTYVAYCFHSVEGYSKIGSYTGNATADGPFIYLGFRPAFFILKDTTTAGSWSIYDSVRDTSNSAYKELEADAGAERTNAGAGRIDFLSNGFKIRDNDGGSYMGQEAAAVFIYMAFAEVPFKYANAK